jgi:hypothetical protein
MSIRVQLEVSGYTGAELAAAAGALADGAAMHNSIATNAEAFVKKYGVDVASKQHRTANRLGATPTGHLSQAYAGIESVSDASSAALLVPRASRLRAAFGQYVLTPGAGKTYLTIPVAAEAYGKRAGEFTDLEYMRVGPKKTPILARPNADGRITTLYVLVKNATIPEDQNLIPFPELEAEARDSVEEYIDKALKASLN